MRSSDHERSPWSGRLAVAATALVTLAALAASAAEPVAVGRYTVLQYNLCGNACGDGGPRGLTELENAIRGRRPLAVTLNEVCENQYARLRDRLSGYAGRFDPTARCRNGARYGNAIFVRAGPLEPVGGWDLPNPARDEPRRLMCAGAEPPAGPRLVVCVTHLSNYSDNTAPQIAAVAAHLDELDGDHALILGGDLNTDPVDARLDALYGSLHEVDSGAGERAPLDHATSDRASSDRASSDHAIGPDVINETTYRQHKYDYVFVSAADWSDVTADVTDATGFSDHEALWATMSLRPSEPQKATRLGGEQVVQVGVHPPPTRL